MGLRQQVSLLLAHGHVQAQRYPLNLVWDESQLVVDRINGLLATEATILHQVMTTAVAAFGKDGGRKANADLTKMIKRLAGNGA